MAISGEILCKQIEEKLNIGESFDILRRRITAAGKQGTLFFIDGFAKDTILNKLEEHFIKAATPYEALHNIPYTEVDITDDLGYIIGSILAGQSVFTLEGTEGAAIIDTRKYPQRSIDEPENDRVLRGPREGFTETLITNTALIRRRIRDCNLKIKSHVVGRKSQTNVAVVYISDRANKKFVEKIEKKLDAIDTDSLSMGQESLAECLIEKQKWNPFPKIRYTERPDSACAMLLEGSVVIICDCYPAVMLLPTSIFDFLQESDDFYFPPLVGTYIRLIRFSVFMLALLLTPTWFLTVQCPEIVPQWLKFLEIDEPAALPLIVQLLLAEFAIDGLKLASLNTPSMLSNSLSVVGGLILGDFAVQTGWFCKEVILYMAIVSIAAFTQQSYELGYAFKFMRITDLILTAFFGVYGYFAGYFITLLLIVFNKTVDGSVSYLYPIIPFNAPALRRLLIKNRGKRNY